MTKDKTKPGKAARIVAVLWADAGQGHAFYHVVRITAYDQAGLYITYDIRKIDRDLWADTWAWIRTKAAKWARRGIWYNARAGLAFLAPSAAGDPEPFAELAHAVDFYANHNRIMGQWQHAVIIPAPVRWDPFKPITGKSDDYMTTTRSRSAMWKLRRDHPNAGELAYTPMDVVTGDRDLYGNPNTGRLTCNWADGVAAWITRRIAAGV